MDQGTYLQGEITMPPKFDLIGIIVQDMTAALAFYRQLGLAIPDGVEDEDHVEVTLPNGLRLAWDKASLIKDIDPHWSPPSGGHRMNLAFLCDNPAEVDAVYARLTAAGYTGLKSPWDAFWGQRYAQVLDPDSNPVDLFAPLT
jgi:catechol 2,3-dioxygenase-like lactoylglutathione lyase family enzyme